MESIQEVMMVSSDAIADGLNEVYKYIFHLDKLEKEVAPIKEFKDLLFSENPSEDELEQILVKIKNI